LLFREALGAVARDRRTSKKVSLRAFAAGAGLSPTYVGEVERGIKEVSSENLARIAAALGFPTAELILGAADRLALADGPSESVSPSQAEDLSRLRRISRALAEDDLRTLVRFASFLAGDRG
jgi:transcriptional regulator with XRE-family HTH domain